MITDTYIKKCEMAGEIQKKWRPKDMDIFCYTKSRELGEACIDNKKRTQEEYNENLKHQFWLPTLEQLFEIWSYLCNTNNKAHPNYLAGDHLPTRFINRIHDDLKKSNWFDKELCLEIIMKDFYHKIWTGKNWVKSNK